MVSNLIRAQSSDLKMATRRGELRETAPTLSLVSGVCAAKLWFSLVINGVRLLPVRLL